MSHKQAKRQRRRAKKVKNKHYQEYADYLINMPLLSRLEVAKQVIKGQTRGIGAAIFFFIIIMLYTALILAIWVEFGDFILKLLKNY